MKIGFFTDYSLPVINGVSISVELFRRALEEQGHTVYVFCPKYPKTPKDEPNTIIRFKSTPGIWYDGYRDTFPWTPKNIQLVKRLKLDIIHTHAGGQILSFGTHMGYREHIPIVYSYHTDVVQYSTIYKSVPFGAAALMLVGKLGTKNVISYPDFFSIFKPEDTGEFKWRQKIVKDVMKYTCNTSNFVIAPSAKVEQMLISYGVTTKIEVIPTGLDINEMTNHQAISDQLAKRINSGGPIILSVGRLGEEKNFQLIIKTLPRLIKKYPNLHLVLVGDGPYEDDLRRLALEKDISKHIIFTGWLDHSTVLDVYRYADVFVFPSQTDTQGLVLNEAAYFGLPIIYSDKHISGVAVDGVNGLYTKPNPTSMATNIDRILSDTKLHHKFSQASQQLAKKIDISIQAKRLESVYKKLISQNGKKK